MTPDRVQKMTRVERKFWLKMLEDQIAKENEAIESKMPKIKGIKKSFKRR